MEQPSRKRGRPKVFLTKEMVEERRMLKRLCKNSRRNFQGELPQEEDGGATLNEKSGNGTVDEDLRDCRVGGANSTGESPPREDGSAAFDENGGNGASDDDLGSSDGGVKLRQVGNETNDSLRVG